MTTISQAKDVKVGKKGTIVIPSAMRHELGLKEGDMLLAVLDTDGRLGLTAVSSDPIERLRKAFRGAFKGIDPVEYQRALRDEDED